MKAIMDFVEEMDEEIEGAENYYKCALYYKDVNSDYSRKYVEMARQELVHAMNLHEMAVNEISKIKEEPTLAMKNAWDEAHVDYVAKVRELEYMLSRI